MLPSTWLCRIGLPTLLLASGVVLSAPTADAPQVKSYAVLVGVNDYGERSTLSPLKYAENDAEELAKALDRKGSPFRGNVVVLTTKRGEKDRDAAPTAANVRKAVKAMLKGKKTDEPVLVALSGHGVQLTVRGPKAKDKDKSFAYFCPQDADFAGVDYETGRHDNLILLSDLLGDLGDSGAGVKMLLMDACRNERRARSLRLNEARLPDGVLALFSCKPGQAAFETNKRGKGHGVFFYRVIEALEGEAADKNGRVTWNRLVEHVTDKVPDDVTELIGNGAKQTPHEIRNHAGKPPVLLTLDAGREDEPAKVVVADKAKKQIENSVGMRFARIPRGKFTMGSSEADQKAALAQLDEKSRSAFAEWMAQEDEHEVEITKDFYLGTTEVTQKQYRAVMGKNPSYFSKDGGGKGSLKGVESTDDFPVESVTYDDALAFIDKLEALPAEKKAGRTYRLATEAEWEYACRGGAKEVTPYHFGSTFSAKHANGEQSVGKPMPVGSYAANGYGLYDMHGNVREWCADWWKRGYYKDSEKKDPKGPDSGTYRILRGGSWFMNRTYARTTYRNGSQPDRYGDDVGFRVVCVAKGQD
jgi:formylglycine-generating enzyme required for sulfatase activity